MEPCSHVATNHDGAAPLAVREEHVAALLAHAMNGHQRLADVNDLELHLQGVFVRDCLLRRLPETRPLADVLNSRPVGDPELNPKPRTLHQRGCLAHRGGTTVSLAPESTVKVIFSHAGAMALRSPFFSENK